MENARLDTKRAEQRNNVRTDTERAKKNYKGELSNGAHNLMTDVYTRDSAILSVIRRKNN
jgi:hypothetical protein